MKLAQRKIKCLARLMLGLALFTQGMVAAYACVTTGASPAQVYSAVAASQNDAAAMPCHRQATPNTNACLGHCTQSDQINADHSVPLTAPVAVATLIVALHAVQYLYLASYPDRKSVV